jgi:hypothetical protein
MLRRKHHARVKVGMKCYSSGQNYIPGPQEDRDLLDSRGRPEKISMTPIPRQNKHPDPTFPQTYNFYAPIPSSLTVRTRAWRASTQCDSASALERPTSRDFETLHMHPRAAFVPKASNFNVPISSRKTPNQSLKASGPV